MRWKVVSSKEVEADPGTFALRLISTDGGGVTVLTNVLNRVELDTIIQASDIAPTLSFAKRGWHSPVFMDPPPALVDVQAAWGDYSSPGLRREMLRTAREDYVAIRMKQYERVLRQGKSPQAVIQELLAELAARIPSQSIDRWLKDPPALPQDA